MPQDKPPRAPRQALTPQQSKARLAAALSQEKASPSPLLPGAIPPPPPPPPAETPRPEARPRRSKPEGSEPVDVSSIDPAVYRAVAKDIAFDGRTTLGRVPRNKRRRHGMSLSCSSEEYEILIAHCDALGVPFSAWAREVLFRAVGRKVPARPKRDR